MENYSAQIGIGYETIITYAHIYIHSKWLVARKMSKGPVIGYNL